MIDMILLEAINKQTIVYITITTVIGFIGFIGSKYISIYIKDNIPDTKTANSFIVKLVTTFFRYAGTIFFLVLVNIKIEFGKTYTLLTCTLFSFIVLNIVVDMMIKNNKEVSYFIEYFAKSIGNAFKRD